MAAMGTYRNRALDMLTTDDARRAFDLSLEPQRVRERYGMHRYGQRALLARRLVEAGASFVTMVMENPSFRRPVASRPTRPTTGIRTPSTATSSTTAGSASRSTTGR